MRDTTRSIMLKAVAMSGALVLTLGSIRGLSADSASALLAGVSIAQLSLPFAGFGLAARIVGTETKDQGALRPVAAFGASSFVVAMLALILGAGSGLSGPFQMYVVLLVFALTISELVRTASGSHASIVAFNLGQTLVGVVLWLGLGLSEWVVLAPLMALIIGIYLVIKATDVSLRVAPLSESSWPSVEDLIKSVRVALVNQFYPIIIVLTSPLLDENVFLLLILVYRTNILMSWQTFYWMRIGHRSTLRGLTEQSMAQNRRMLQLNGLGFAALLVASIALSRTSVGASLLLTSDFVLGLAVFGTLLLLENLIFPYEVFMTYSSHRETDQGVLLVGIVGLTVVVVVAALLPVGLQLYGVILLAELVWLSVRLYSRSVVNSSRSDEQTSYGVTAND